MDDAFNEQLLGLLRCVRCEDASPVECVQVEKRDPQSGGESSVVACTTCGARYGFHDDILDFVSGVPNTSAKPLGQSLMDSAVIAAVYEGRLWRRTHTWFSGVSLRREMDEVLGWMAPLPQGTILDLGCGTGLYARRLAREAPHALVVGIDLSVAMLRQASMLARREGLENLKLIRADMRCLPFRDATLVRIHAGGVLHLLPDLPGALREISRTIVGAGCLTAMTVRRGGGVVGWFQQRARRRGKASFLSTEQFEDELRGVGFSEIQTRGHGLMLLLRAEKVGN